MPSHYAAASLVKNLSPLVAAKRKLRAGPPVANPITGIARPDTATGFPNLPRPGVNPIAGIPAGESGQRPRPGGILTPVQTGQGAPNAGTVPSIRPVTPAAPPSGGTELPPGSIPPVRGLDAANKEFETLTPEQRFFMSPEQVRGLSFEDRQKRDQAIYGRFDPETGTLAGGGEGVENPVKPEFDQGGGVFAGGFDVNKLRPESSLRRAVENVRRGGDPSGFLRGEFARASGGPGVPGGHGVPGGRSDVQTPRKKIDEMLAGEGDRIGGESEAQMAALNRPDLTDPQTVRTDGEPTADIGGAVLRASRDRARAQATGGTPPVTERTDTDSPGDEVINIRPKAGADGELPAFSEFGPDSTLRNVQINPSASERLRGTQGLSDTALRGLFDTPDRKALAEETFQALRESTEPQFQQTLRQVGQRAASLGRIGAGMTTSELGDVASNREKSLGNLQRQLSSEAAGQTLSDRLSRFGVASGFEGDVFGRELTGREELRGERGFQDRLAQQALDNRIRELLTSEGIRSGRSQEELERLRLAGMGFSDSTGAGSAYAQGLANQAAGSGNAAANLLYLNELRRRAGGGGGGGAGTGDFSTDGPYYG